MTKPLLTHELWGLIEQILLTERPKPKGGRPRFPDKQALIGVLFVLKIGIARENLPQEMGCRSGMTCGEDSEIGKNLVSGTVST